MFGLKTSEFRTLKKLDTPIKIQNFLDTLAINWEKNGETYMSPRLVLRKKKAHCLEGALLAGLALWIAGEEPLLLDLRAYGDEDHVITLYKRNGYWGAISKTNHSTLRYRDPVYKTIRELVLSYFHEYFNDKTGKKALREYSTRPFNIKKLGTKWITSEENLQYIAQAIDDAPHTRLFPKKQEMLLRKADSMERRASAIIEWPKKHSRT
jgi:hypothetical protein